MLKWLKNECGYWCSLHAIVGVLVRENLSYTIICEGLMKRLAERFRRTKVLPYTIISLLMTTLPGCMATSCYTTGRTLKPGEEVARIGADYVLNTISDGNHVRVGITKRLPISFVPSVGLAFGLPLRLETSFRWYPVSFLEGSLREQLNPRSFNAFDASANLTYGGYIGKYSYLKYGLTVSKRIDSIEPYVDFAIYHAVGRMSSDMNFFDNGGIESFTSSINASRSMAFGIAVPIAKVKLFPEVDYLFSTSNKSLHLWSFGIGLQINPK